MTILRKIYVRYFRGGAIGNTMRNLWYWNWSVSHRSFKSRREHNRLFEFWRSASQQAGLFFYRTLYVAKYYWPRLRAGFFWVLESRETSNFTYDLTARNEMHLAHMIALALRLQPEEIAGYIGEIKQDKALRDTVVRQVKQLGRQGGYDPTARFGRRVGWYALVRAMKPSVVVETGVEKGLGATVLCAALSRNSMEGHLGHYYGTDIDQAAGGLLTEPYRAMGEILYGDSIDSLCALNVKIDIFINDSDHSAEYEGREYEAIAQKLSERAVIVGDNAHVSDELLKFSCRNDRHFLYFREEPIDHWYLGAGIGLSFK